MPDRFPQMDTIFTFTPAGQVEFAHGNLPPDTITSIGENNRPLPTTKFRDWMTLMILWSNNYAAGLVINALGYPYINGALRAAGFWDPPTKNGIWVSANYSNEREAWKPGADDLIGLSSRGKKHYKATTNLVGTARQFARLITLAALDKLFDGDAVTCRDMLFVMRKGVLPGNTSFIRDALEHDGTTVQQVNSKLGIGVPSRDVPGRKGIHDCAVILREKTPGTQLRYVAVVIGGYDRGFDAGAFDAVAVQLDDCIARSH
jgi:Beta-lactamase enzyme family